MKYLLLSCFLLSFYYSEAQNKKDINILNINFTETTLSKQYIYSESKVANDFNSVLASDSLFQFQNKKFLNSGIFNKYNWIKINIENKSNIRDFIFELNQTYIDSINFYVVKNHKIAQTFPKKGLYFKDKDNNDFLSNQYAYLYPLSINKNDKITIYIHAIVNDGGFKATNKIWSKTHYETRKKDIKIRTSYLLFFGGFTVLVVIISIAMFFFSKKRIYFYYAVFVSVIFLNLVGLRHFFSPLYFEKYLFFGNNFTEMFALLQVVFILLYLNHFLSLKSYYHKIYRILKYTAILTFAFFVFGLFLRKFNWFYAFLFYLTKIQLLLVSIGMYAIAIKLALKKELMAYYFLIAYFPLMLFVSYYILTAFKLTNGYNPLQWELVIFVEIFVLTIAMAHKYYLLIKENRIYEKEIYEQRLKISRDLHDNIGAQLTFIISSIENLQYGFTIKNKKLTSKLIHISNFTKGTIYELRDTIWAMNKNSITMDDLKGRISNFIDKANLASSSIDFNFTTDKSISKDEEFTSVKGMNIYRIIQEAIHNAIKYADAKQITVHILRKNESIQVKISDNGKGFLINQETNGNGLTNMKKRTNDIDGTLHIKSTINKGTEITLLC